MIRPSSRLVFLAALLLPAAALGAALGGPGWLLSLAAAGLALAAAADLARSRDLLAGMTAGTDAVCRLRAGQEGVLAVRLRAEGWARSLRAGIPAPEGLAIRDNPRVAGWPRGHDAAVLEWLLTPARRGRWTGLELRLEALSRAGLWEVRRALPLGVEVRAHSDLSRERRSLAGLFLRRGYLGMHLQRQIGKGREFEQLREYIAGDSYEDVHWRATAKRGAPVTKLFQVERTQNILVALDHSRLAGRRVRAPERPAGEEAVLEEWIRATLLLFMSAERQADRYGLLTFGRQVTRYLAPGGGKAHLQGCQDALFNLEPEAASPDYETCFAQLRYRLRRRTLILFLTDLTDPVAEDMFREHVEMIRRQHLCVAFQFRGGGVRPLFGGDEPADLEAAYDRLAGHLKWDKLRRLQAELTRKGVRLVSAEQEQMAVTLVNTYLNLKRRQLL